MVFGRRLPTAVCFFLIRTLVKFGLLTLWCVLWRVVLVRPMAAIVIVLENRERTTRDSLVVFSSRFNLLSLPGVCLSTHCTY